MRGFIFRHLMLKKAVKCFLQSIQLILEVYHKRDPLITKTENETNLKKNNFIPVKVEENDPYISTKWL